MKNKAYKLFVQCLPCFARRWLFFYHLRQTEKIMDRLELKLKQAN